MNITRPITISLLAAGALGLAACGKSYTTADIPSGGEKVPAGLNVAAPAPKPANPALSTKPVVTVPKGAAPKSLVVKDLVKGTGTAATKTSKVTVQYVGVLYKTGKQFDASWDRNQPFTTQLGQGQVIPGWDQGIPGMKVGGRRELIIPAKLAYGAKGQPPTIPANSPLVFVIDLESVG
jgi:FKBP-type peptidyl-prolyl cis-trans isomerase